MKYERLTDSETAIMLKNTKGVSWGKRYMSANHQLNQDLEKFLEERK